MDVCGTMLAAGLWSTWVWPVLQFVIGLGVVVAVHEFGHFIVAKLVGIKVEKFALGFGPKLVGVQWGETEYCINALPLGGFVKMLGQDDFRPMEDAPDRDPRAFNSKSVGARFAVISAGVIMNAVLAVVLFAVIAMVGRDFVAPVVGDVVEHYPASEAEVTWVEGGPEGAATAPATATAPAGSVGLRPGDRITRIRGDSMILAVLGEEVDRFDRLALTSTLADPNDVYRVWFEREVDGETWTGRADLGVRPARGMMGGERMSFGLGPATDLTVTPSFAYDAPASLDPYQPGDVLVALDGEPIRHAWRLDEMLEGTSGPNVPVTVRRGGEEVALTAPRGIEYRPNVVFLPDGTKLDLSDYRLGEDPNDGDREVLSPLADGGGGAYAMEDLIIPLSREIVDFLGMVPLVRIMGILPGKPAEQAGLKPGDVIVHYGDTPLPTLGEIQDVNKKVARAGGETQVVVRRGGKTLDPITVRPQWDDDRQAGLIGIARYVDLDGTVVAGVRPGSVAAEAGLSKGNVVTALNGRDVASWREVYEALRELGGQEVTLTYLPAEGADTEATAEIGELTPAVFDPGDYAVTIFPGPHVGLNTPLQFTLRKGGVGEAIAWSAKETVGFILTTYASIRALFVGSVSSKEFMGPVGMGGVAVTAARQDVMHLVYFMAFISTALAVFNFLPLPVVDGGHAVFLIVEKIRGKPVPVRIMNIIQMVGLAALLLLFLALTFQDIMRFF